MFENPRRAGKQEIFATNVPKILDIKSSSEQIFFRKLSLGAPELRIRSERESLDDSCMITEYQMSIDV